MVDNTTVSYFLVIWRIIEYIKYNIFARLIISIRSNKFAIFDLKNSRAQFVKNQTQLHALSFLSKSIGTKRKCNEFARETIIVFCMRAYN